MSYAALEDFVNLFKEEEASELCNYSDPEQSAERTRVVSALDAASGEINTFIGQRYGTADLPIIPYLKDACSIIARKNLYSDGETETVRAQYNDVIKRLTDIRDGKGVLIDESGEIVPDKDLSPPEGQISKNVYVKSRRARIPDFGQYFNPYL